MAFFALLAWAAFGDATRFRISNGTTLGLVLLYPAHVLASPVPVEWLWALAVAAGTFAAGLFLFARGVVGGGDVKLLAGAALWAGPKLIAPLLLLMVLSGGVLALGAFVLEQCRRYRVASAPGLDPRLDSDPTPARVPYGIAIAVGAAYVGARLVSG